MKEWLYKLYDRFISSVTDYPCQKTGHIAEQIGSYKINSYTENVIFHCTKCPYVVELIMKI